jgi:hypothetical protein
MRNRHHVGPSSLHVISVVIAAGILLALFFSATAHAEGGGKGPDTVKANVIMTLELNYGLVETSTDLYTEKGPMSCTVRCGKIVPHYDSGGKFVSANVKCKSYETVVGASYHYASNDGSGDYDGSSHWDGRDVLPAQKSHTDAQGGVHTLYLASVYVQVFSRAPFVKRRGLQPKHVGGTS